MCPFPPHACRPPTCGRPSQRHCMLGRANNNSKIWPGLGPPACPPGNGEREMEERRRGGGRAIIIHHGAVTGDIHSGPSEWPLRQWGKGERARARRSRKQVFRGGGGGGDGQSDESGAAAAHYYMSSAKAEPPTQTSIEETKCCVRLQQWTSERRIRYC